MTMMWVEIVSSKESGASELMPLSMPGRRDPATILPVAEYEVSKFRCSKLEKLVVRNLVLNT